MAENLPNVCVHLDHRLRRKAERWLNACAKLKTDMTATSFFYVSGERMCTIMVTAQWTKPAQ